MNVMMGPEPLDHSSATANLHLVGLGIMHFDHRNTWEINFLRNKKHRLFLSVTGNGQTDKPIEIEPEACHLIEIITEDGIAPDFEQFPNGYWFSNEQFNRGGNKGHAEDFGWVINLANFAEFPLHGLVRRRSTLGASLTSTTKVIVPDVIFYTHRKTGYELTLALLNIPSPFPFGRTNTIVGADIICKETGAVVIKIDGEVYKRLPHVNGSPYKILLENSEPRGPILPPDRMIIDRVLGQFIKGDFFLYYDFIDVLGARYDGVCKEIIRSSDCDCNMAYVSNFA